MATLKISDLSVGDWVEIDHEVFGWQPAQINVCGDLGIGAYFKDIDPEEEYDCTLSQARPIPITAEILEKNGFENICGMWFNSDTLMEFEQCRDGWFRTINCGEYSVYSIKYVHQFQHALRLAGIDKEINL